MCVNSIVFYISFRIEVRRSSFSSFICCNFMILCSETSVCRCNIHSLIKNFAILRRGPSPLCPNMRILRHLLLKLNFYRFCRSGSKFYCKYSISEHLNCSLKRPSSRLSCFLCSSRHIRGKFPAASRVKQSFDSSCSHSVFISGHIDSSSSFSARARYSD